MFISGLPQFPDDSLEPKVYSAILSIHLALQNLDRNISLYIGADTPASDEWGNIGVSQLRTGNDTRIYVEASTSIIRGQIINLHSSSGLKCRLAQANSASTMAHGIANSSGGSGDFIEVNWLRTLTDAIGSLSQGTLYYLSPSVAGAIQNTRPSTAGQIIQPIGVGLAAALLAADIPLSYIQL